MSQTTALNALHRDSAYQLADIPHYQNAAAIRRTHTALADKTPGIQRDYTRHILRKPCCGRTNPAGCPVQLGQDNI
jgi:hypothetical protein